MKYFKMSLEDASQAQMSVWNWQCELEFTKLTRFRTTGDSTVVVSTEERLGEAMLRQVLIDENISFVESDTKPEVAKGFGID